MNKELLFLSPWFTAIMSGDFPFSFFTTFILLNVIRVFWKVNKRGLLHVKTEKENFCQR